MNGPPSPPPAPADRSRSRLDLVDVPPPRSWKVRLLKLVAWGLLTGSTLAGFAVLGLYYKYSAGLPEIPHVDAYAPPILSEVFTDDQVLAGEFYNERRKVVPYDRVPKRLIQAFIASEDASFFDHMGIDFLGTARAAFKTILKKASGRGSVQGGSTLTQQTAKAVLISAEGYKTGTEKDLKRKIREAILALRLEKALTKEEILYLYLNNVYLGHHAYGVQAAAENYFRKDVSDLTLAEMALIAGLPQAPSSYSPFEHPQAAKHRRSYVLRRMLEEGMISHAEYDQANAADIKVYPVEDVFHDFAPYFTEQVRKDVVNRYSNEQLLDQGLQIFTTMDSERQRAAQDSMLHGLLQLDKRQGYRGPLMQLTTAPQRAAFLAKARAAMGKEPLREGGYYVALVQRVSDDGLYADVQVGNQTGLLPLLGMRWARPVNPEVYYPSAMLKTMKKTVHAGDVVVVRAVSQENLTDDKEQFDKKLYAAIPQGVQLFRLEQEPELQGALVSIDPKRQYLTAMVGGYDFDDNEFNRAFQACRQPGSSFKPLSYSAAIEKLNWTEATTIVDSPIVENDPEHMKQWTPENFSREFHGDVLLRTALVQSMNIPAVKTFIAVGIPAMTEWAAKFGLSRPLNQDYSSALGSTCVYPYELAQVYATFNRLGKKLPTYFIRKIEDRYGRTLEDHTSFDDPWASLQDRVSAGYARLFEPGDQLMSRETGFVVQDLLRGVVKDPGGTGGGAQALHKPAAGKTGTTNDAFDAWFSGFTQDLVTTVWVGYDNNPHPLSRYETGGHAALPIWLAYMKQALQGRPQGEFDPPPDVQVVPLLIEEKTGKVAPPGARNAITMYFKKGTEPQEAAPPKGQLDPGQFIMQAN